MGIMSAAPKLPKPPKPPANTAAPNMARRTDRHYCDADSSCDRAQYEIVVIVNNVAKRLYFCNHHYQYVHSYAILQRGYEVIKL